MSDLHQQMHETHRVWESDVNMWRDDVAAWQHELATARSEFKELQAALEKHEELVRKHAGAVRLEEQNFAAHEHALAEYEHGGSGDDLPDYVSKHREEADRHGRQRAEHEDLKRLHHTIMAHWRLLVQALVDRGEEPAPKRPQITAPGR